MRKVFLDEKILEYAFIPVILSRNSEMYAHFVSNARPVLSKITEKALQSMTLFLYESMDKMDDEDREYWKIFYSEMNHEMLKRKKINIEKGRN